MPKKPPYARIAITLPAPVLAAADRLAKRLDRSRSWVIAESVRRYADDDTRRSPLAVREAGLEYEPGVEAGLGYLRRVQLEADLQLTPEARVRAAERTAREARLLRPPAGQQLLLFDRPEEYLRWKQREATGR
jgi:predicted transcriptional regulator